MTSKRMCITFSHRGRSSRITDRLNRTPSNQSPQCFNRPYEMLPPFAAPAAAAATGGIFTAGVPSSGAGPLATLPIKKGYDRERSTVYPI
jgi:hypothetical protein